jgi:hypothetical protein
MLVRCKSVRTFETTAIVAVGVAVAVITLTIVMGVGALRRPLSDEQYRGEQWEAGLEGILAVSGLIRCGSSVGSQAAWVVRHPAGEGPRRAVECRVR